MKASLTGILLFVQNVELLKKFYLQHFQMELLEETPDQWVLLKAGNCEIGLHRIGAEYLQEGEAPFKFDNNTKLIFDMDEDIFAVHQQFTQQQITVREVKTWEGYAYQIFDGEDPEGNVFQVRMKK